MRRGFYYPKKQNIRAVPVSKEVSEALLFLLGRNTYRTYHNFFMLDNTSGSSVAISNAGSVFSTRVEKDIAAISFPEDVDVYITSNGFNTYKTRDGSALQSIENIVVDLDCHDKGADIDAVYEHAKRVADSIPGALSVKPNLISLTGRGIHLWYSVVPCHASYAPLAVDVARMLAREAAEYLKSTNDRFFSVDEASSVRLSGVFRVPGSYNSKAKRYSECILLHLGAQTIFDLHRSLSLLFPLKKKKRKSNSTNPSPSPFAEREKSVDYIESLKHRADFIKMLARRRGEQGPVIGRESMLFALYATECAYREREEAVRDVFYVNGLFPNPLPDKEVLRSAIAAVDRKPYKLSREKFFSLISAAPSERSLFSRKKREGKKKPSLRDIAAKEKHETEKEERDAFIASMYRCGKSIKEIMEEMTLSRPTVIAALKRRGAYKPSVCFAALKKRKDKIARMMKEIIKGKKKRTPFWRRKESGGEAEGESARENVNFGKIRVKFSPSLNITFMKRGPTIAIYRL